MKLATRALALTCAACWGGLVLFLGLANLVWPPYGEAFLQAVASVYPGYTAAASLGQAVLGTLYATVDGAATGLIFAWIYNAFVGVAAKKPEDSSI
jgi:hypothetical protein